MNRSAFLISNVALAFYNVGTIWAHEVDIFRSWKLVDASSFRRVQDVHWRKLPYWIFAPVGLAFAGSIALVRYHPVACPVWMIWAALGCQCASHTLTAALWGPCQAKLARDPLGSRSPYLAKILSTHWIRTALVNAYALLLLVCLLDVTP